MCPGEPDIIQCVCNEKVNQTKRKFYYRTNWIWCILWRKQNRKKRPQFKWQRSKEKKRTEKKRKIASIFFRSFCFHFEFCFIFLFFFLYFCAEYFLSTNPSIISFRFHEHKQQTEKNWVVWKLMRVCVYTFFTFRFVIVSFNLIWTQVSA